MIVALLCLVGSDAVLAAVLVLTSRQAAAERARLVNAVLSRTPDEFAKLQLIDRPRQAKPANAEPKPVQVGA